MLKLIIFDMDGVLFDTEYLDFQLQQDYIKSLSKNPQSLTHEDFSQLVGRSGQDLLTEIKTLSQTDLTFTEIEQGLKMIENEKYRPENYLPSFRSEVISILDFARAHQIALALASSTRKTYILKLLTGCGIRGYFDEIVSGEDVVSSKPDPAIYLSVLERLQLPAHQALAIEDSPAGIAAAKGAEIPVIAYEEKRMAVDQSQADVIAKDMKAILAYIKHQV